MSKITLGDPNKKPVVLGKYNNLIEAEKDINKFLSENPGYMLSDLQVVNPAFILVIMEHTTY